MLALIVLVAAQPEMIHVQVDGVDREALVYRPSGNGVHPIIFGFHGHTGNARQASRSFGLQDAWPDAIVVYPQGLPTKTFYDKEGRFSGWTNVPTESNRDIRFFDALLARVSGSVRGAMRRVFAMGHSNGAQFMYTLWATRGNELAAIGSCEGAGGQLMTLSPKPFFITIGDQDALVPPALQHRSLDAVFRVDGSAKSGEPYGEKGTLYKGTQPVVLWAYHGGHAFPSDCVPSMIRFFQSVRQ